MSPAFDCEALFNRAQELGASVTALGDMLQWAPDEVQQGTLVALGSIFYYLGKDITKLHTEYIDKTFHQIITLQESEAAAKESPKQNDFSWDSPEVTDRMKKFAEVFLAAEAARKDRSS